jgi:hypothetical protein
VSVPVNSNLIIIGGVEASYITKMLHQLGWQYAPTVELDSGVDALVRDCNAMLLDGTDKPDELAGKMIQATNALADCEPWVLYEPRMGQALGRWWKLLGEHCTVLIVGDDEPDWPGMVARVDPKAVASCVELFDVERAYSLRRGGKGWRKEPANAGAS